MEEVGYGKTIGKLVPGMARLLDKTKCHLEGDFKNKGEKKLYGLIN